MSNDEVNKFNLIKKKFLLRKRNLTKTENKTQGNPFYFKKER